MISGLVWWAAGQLGVIGLAVNDLGRYLRIIYMRLGYCERFYREWPIVSLVARSLVVSSFIARSVIASSFFTSGPSSDFGEESGG